MNKSNLPVLPAALGFFGLAFFGLSLYFLGPEFRAFKAGALPQKSTAISALETRPQAAWATSSRLAQLDDCASVQMRREAPFLPMAERRASARTCLRLARSVLRGSPTLSLAHYAVAVSALQMGDRRLFRHALITARTTGANEAWLASRRLNLGLIAFDRLPAQDLAGLEQDLAVLLSNGATTANLGQMLALYPQRRGFLLATIERQPPRLQELFLRRVSLQSARAPAK